MTNKHALPALLELHATLAGEMQRSNEHYFKLAQQMRSIESVIKLMDPAFRIHKIAVKRRKVNPWFKHGTLYRTCLAILKNAEGPLTASEIAKRAFLDAKIEHSEEDIQRLRKTVRMAMVQHDDGAVRAIKDGEGTRWALQLPLL